MNIGIDIRPLMDKNRTGVGEYTHELLNAVFKLDKVNQYFLFSNSRKDVSVPQWKQDNVHHMHVRWPNKLLNVLILVFKRPRLDRMIARRCGTKKLDYFLSPNLNFTSLSRGVKHILTVHDLSFKFLPECFSLKRRWWHRMLNPKKQCKKADIILVPSKSTKQDLVECYSIGEKKIKLMYPGLSSIFSKQDLEGRDIVSKYNLPQKFILFLGTIEPRKNIKGIVRAYEKSNLLSKGWSLIIAGGLGWKYEDILQDIEKTAGVEYIGYIDAVDKPVLYRLADLFIYPSLYEGFGLPVLEAMASSTPVVTSNRSSLTEVVGESALLVNPYNVEEMSGGLEMVLNDQELKDEFVRRGERRGEGFVWEETANKFTSILV